MHDVSFRPVQPEDLPQLAVFCSQFPGDGRSVEFWTRRFKHWWQDNPAMTDDWLRGYLLLAEGRIQGVCLSIPLSSVLDGKLATVSLASTWRVMPDFRAYSMAIMFQISSSQSSILSFSGTPTPRALKLIKGSHVQRRSKMAATLHSGSATALLFKYFTKPLATRRLPKLVSAGKPLQLEEIKFAIDTAWQAGASSPTGPVRNWAYWRWFSTENPTVACTTFILPSDQGSSEQILCAMAVDFGDGQLQVTDIWPLTSSPERMKAMLKLIFHHARRSRFHSILVPHWTEGIAQACSAFVTLRQSQIPADIWTNPFPLLAEPNTQHWPLHTGDALL